MTEGGRRLGYQPALDGVRALAIIPVVLLHIFDWPPVGALGVDVFFVLSGFLITTILLDEWGEFQGISLPKFYARRALRLFPALVVMLGVFVAYQLLRYLSGSLPASDLKRALMTAVYGASYISNWFLAFRPKLIGSLYHLWSLATEEQFYLIWPPLLLIALRKRMKHKHLLVAVLGLALVIMVNRLVIYLSGAPLRRVAFAPDTRSDALLIGCMCGIWYVHSSAKASSRFLNALRRAWIPALGFILLAMTIPPNWDFFYLGGLTMFSIASAILILVCVTDPHSPLTQVLTKRPLVYIGKLSYSLYLWHVTTFLIVGEIAFAVLNTPPEGALKTAVQAAALVGSVIAAMLSRYLVEVPFLKKKDRFTPIHRVPGTQTTSGS